VSGTDVNIENANQPKATFTSPYVQQGGERLIFHLVVTDSQNRQDTDSIGVDVVWHNSPPVADAGPDQEVSETHLVNLDGSASYDSDGDIESYAWRQTEGPAIELKNASDPSIRFRAPRADNGDIVLEFELTVTDSRGGNATDTVHVTVLDIGDPPNAIANTEKNTVYPGWSITLDGSSSESANGEEGQLSYMWKQISGPPVDIENSDSPTPGLTIPEINDHENSQIVLELIVTDEKGLVDTEQISLTVNQNSEPPIAEAGEDQEVRKGATVILDGSASDDPDDGISSFAWKQVGEGPEVELSDPAGQTAEFTAPEVDDETVLAFELTVTDYGQNSDTDEVSITVLPARSGGGGGGGGCFISTLDF
jgi:hypothetical protein